MSFLLPYGYNVLILNDLLYFENSKVDENRQMLHGTLKSVDKVKLMTAKMLFCFQIKFREWKGSSRNGTNICWEGTMCQIFLYRIYLYFHQFTLTTTPLGCVVKEADTWENVEAICGGGGQLSVLCRYGVPETFPVISHKLLAQRLTQGTD